MLCGANREEMGAPIDEMPQSFSGSSAPRPIFTRCQNIICSSTSYSRRDLLHSEFLLGPRRQYGMGPFPIVAPTETPVQHYVAKKQATGCARSLSGETYRKTPNTLRNTAIDLVRDFFALVSAARSMSFLFVPQAELPRLLPPPPPALFRLLLCTCSLSPFLAPVLRPPVPRPSRLRVTPTPAPLPCSIFFFAKARWGIFLKARKGQFDF